MTLAGLVGLAVLFGFAVLFVPVLWAWPMHVRRVEGVTLPATPWSWRAFWKALAWELAVYAGAALIVLFFAWASTVRL